MTTAQILIGSMFLATLVNPLLIIWTWVRRLTAKSPDRTARYRLGWVSLGFASIGFIAYVLFVVLGPESATPAFDRWYAVWLRIAVVISGATLLTGVMGKGRMQWTVPFSAIATVVSVALSKILE